MAFVTHHIVSASLIGTVPVVEGQIIFAGDNGRVWRDLDNGAGTVLRVEVTKMIYASSKSSVTNPQPASQGFVYYFADTRTFATWNGTGWDDASALDVDAENVAYDNTTSGLTATNVQDAVDELAGGLDVIDGKVTELISDKMDKVPTADEDAIAVFDDAGQVIDSGKTLSGITTDIQSAVSNRLTRSDIIAGTNVVLTPGSGNTVTVSVPGIPLPDKWSSSENGTGAIGATNAYDSTLLTLLTGSGNLSVGDIVIFSNGFQAEVTAIDSPNVDEFEAVTISIPQSVAWGGIGGTLTNQTDLVNALNAKVNVAQGTANEGKTLVVDVSGNLVLSDFPDTGVTDVEVDGVSVVNSSGVAEIDLSNKLDKDAFGNENDYLFVNSSGEIDARPLDADKVIFDDTTAGLSKANTQTAIEKLAALLTWVQH